MNIRITLSLFSILFLFGCLLNPEEASIDNTTGITADAYNNDAVDIADIDTEELYTKLFEDDADSEFVDFEDQEDMFGDDAAAFMQAFELDEHRGRKARASEHSSEVPEDSLLNIELVACMGQLPPLRFKDILGSALTASATFYETTWDQTYTPAENVEVFETWEAIVEKHDTALEIAADGSVTATYKTVPANDVAVIDLAVKAEYEYSDSLISLEVVKDYDTVTIDNSAFKASEEADETTEEESIDPAEAAEESEEETEAASESLEYVQSILDAYLFNPDTGELNLEDGGIIKSAADEYGNNFSLISTPYSDNDYHLHGRCFRRPAKLGGISQGKPKVACLGKLVQNAQLAGYFKLFLGINRDELTPFAAGYMIDLDGSVIAAIRTAKPAEAAYDVYSGLLDVIDDADVSEESASITVYSNILYEDDYEADLASPIDANGHGLAKLHFFAPSSDSAITARAYQVLGRIQTVNAEAVSDFGTFISE
ncbi:MAG: hypothetical protein ABIA04_13975 [Pseudomonadota bacterium]